MPRHKKPPYQCMCCGYTTDRKSCMQDHFYKLKKPCPKILNNIELTEEIKENILQNRIYYIEKKPTTINQTINNSINNSINNYNQINNFINNLDIIDKITGYSDHNKIELIDFQDKVENKYNSKVKRLNTNAYKYGFKRSIRNYRRGLYDFSNKLRRFQYSI